MSDIQTSHAITPGTGATLRVSPWTRWRHNVIGWLFASPWMIIFLVFLAIPILVSLVMSFTDFGLANLIDPFSAHFTGIQNYVHLFHDPLFLTSATNTAYFVIVGVPLNVILSLFIAMGVNQGINFVRTIFRVGYYLPVVTSIVAVAVVWRYLLNPDVGLLNNALHLVGIQGQDWLGNPVLAMPSIIAMAVWRNVGSTMIIFLAGLQGVDQALYEASNIDGAGAFARFRYITLPMLQPTLLFVTVITSIGFLQLFAEPFVMTGGGPLNQTLSVSMYLYQEGFKFFNQGYASSIGYVMFVAIVILTFIQFRLLRSQT